MKCAFFHSDQSNKKNNWAFLKISPTITIKLVCVCVFFSMYPVLKEPLKWQYHSLYLDIKSCASSSQHFSSSDVKLAWTDTSSASSPKHSFSQHAPHPPCHYLAFPHFHPSYHFTTIYQRQWNKRYKETNFRILSPPHPNPSRHFSSFHTCTAILTFCRIWSGEAGTPLPSFFTQIKSSP